MKYTKQNKSEHTQHTHRERREREREEREREKERHEIRRDVVLKQNAGTRRGRLIFYKSTNCIYVHVSYILKKNLKKKKRQREKPKTNIKKIKK
jgi:hypothetical protein